MNRRTHTFVSRREKRTRKRRRRWPLTFGQWFKRQNVQHTLPVIAHYGWQLSPHERHWLAPCIDKG